MPPLKAAPRRAEFKRGFAKYLRANPTDAERRLWRLLRGEQHGADQNAAYDTSRTQWLEERGYKVLRFSNGEVLKGQIADAIWYEAANRLPLPERPSAVRPSLKGRVG